MIRKKIEDIQVSLVYFSNLCGFSSHVVSHGQNIQYTIKYERKVPFLSFFLYYVFIIVVISYH